MVYFRIFIKLVLLVLFIGFLLEIKVMDILMKIVKYIQSPDQRIFGLDVVP